MPFSRVPGEPLDESRLENPKERGWFVGVQEIPGGFEGRVMFFLR
jgi:hypothetical protein